MIITKFLKVENASDWTELDKVIEFKINEDINNKFNEILNLLKSNRIPEDVDLIVKETGEVVDYSKDFSNDVIINDPILEFRISPSYEDNRFKSAIIYPEILMNDRKFIEFESFQWV